MEDNKMVFTDPTSQRLDEIVHGLYVLIEMVGLLTDTVVGKKVEATMPEPSAPAQPVAASQAPCEAAPAPVKAEAPALKMEDLQQKVIKLISAQTTEEDRNRVKAAIRDVLTQHANPPRVSELKPESFAAVWAKLEELEG